MNTCAGAAASQKEQHEGHQGCTKRTKTLVCRRHRSRRAESDLFLVTPQRRTLFLGAKRLSGDCVAPVAPGENLCVFAGTNLSSRGAKAAGITQASWCASCNLCGLRGALAEAPRHDRTRTTLVRDFQPRLLRRGLDPFDLALCRDGRLARAVRNLAVFGRRQFQHAEEVLARPRPVAQSRA